MHALVHLHLHGRARASYINRVIVSRDQLDLVWLKWQFSNISSTWLVHLRLRITQLHSPDPDTLTQLAAEPSSRILTTSTPPARTCDTLGWCAAHTLGVQNAWCAYHTTFLTVYKNSSHTPKVAVGGVVIIHSDDKPKGMWKLGKVEELLNSPDGEHRAAVLRVAGQGRSGKRLQRPVQRLYPLHVQTNQIHVCEIRRTSHM